MIVLQLPKEVKNIISKLEQNGHEAYAVGGCVRDCILGKTPKDWDITTSAKPEEIKSLFKKTVDTGIQHGTVTVIDNHNGYEVTTYRLDGKYSDGRHPESVEFTPDLKEDLKRRDFTINAMAYNDINGLVDEFCGQEDLEKGIIRCVGDPTKRFEEDALRMMRAVRFSARFGFEIENKTEQAIMALAPTLEKISMERIREEFIGVITSPNPSKVHELYHMGLTKAFLWEWDRMEETTQNTIHHNYNVAEHTIKVMENVPQDTILRMAACLHDVGKPECRLTDERGDHFKGHPAVGAEMATKIMRRLKFDNDTNKAVQKLILYHDLRPIDDEKAVRKVMNKTGDDIYPALFILKRADILGQSDYKRDEKIKLIEAFEKNRQSILDKKQAVSLKELAIGGADIMSLGVNKGPEIGMILHRLLDLVIENPEDNDKDILINKCKEWIN